MNQAALPHGTGRFSQLSWRHRIEPPGALLIGLSPIDRGIAGGIQDHGRLILTDDCLDRSGVGHVKIGAVQRPHGRGSRCGPHQLASELPARSGYEHSHAYSSASASSGATASLGESSGATPVGNGQRTPTCGSFQRIDRSSGCA